MVVTTDLMGKKIFKDTALELYLRFGLRMASCLGQYAYPLIALTGHKFRDVDSFASTLGKKGILRLARQNLISSAIVAPGTENEVIREYLKFESRFALENIWIENKNKKNILKAFKKEDVIELRDALKNGQFIITTLHTSALYSFVSLVSLLGHDAPFVVMNPLAAQIENPAPFQKVLLRLFPKWLQSNKFIFIQDGNVFGNCLKILESGKSLIIAPDTPYSSPNNIRVNFMGKTTAIAPGIAVLSKRCDVDVLVVTHGASDCTHPYGLNMQRITEKNIELCMREIFNFFQTSIQRHPACWNGWLYWDQMDHMERANGNQ